MGRSRRERGGAAARPVDKACGGVRRDGIGASGEGRETRADTPRSRAGPPAEGAYSVPPGAGQQAPWRLLWLVPLLPRAAERRGGDAAAGASGSAPQATQPEAAEPWKLQFPTKPRWTPDAVVGRARTFQPGRLRSAGRGRCVRGEGRPSHFGPRLELVQLVQFVAAQNAEKGSKAPSNYTKQCGLRYPNTPLTQAPKSTITSSHGNPVRGHGTGQRDEFLDQASAFILQRWPREVWSHSHYLGTSSELRPKKPPTE